MARSKIDPAVSRKAYAMAEKALREKHAAEFAALVDVSYMELGVESPRQRRERLADERMEAALLRKQKVAARMAKKIEEAKAFLREQGVEVEESA